MDEYAEMWPQSWHLSPEVTSKCPDTSPWSCLGLVGQLLVLASWFQPQSVDRTSCTHSVISVDRTSCTHSVNYWLPLASVSAWNGLCTSLWIFMSGVQKLRVLPLYSIVILMSVVEESFILIIASPAFDITAVSTLCSLFSPSICQTSLGGTVLHAQCSDVLFS